MRLPGLGDQPQLLLGRPGRQPFEVGRRGLQRQVAGGEYIRPLQGKQQIDFRRPHTQAADAGNGCHSRVSSGIAARVSVASTPAPNASATARAWLILGRDRPAPRSAFVVRGAESPRAAGTRSRAQTRRQMAAAAWLLICWPTMALSRPPKTPAWRVRQGRGPASFSTRRKSGSIAGQPFEAGAGFGGRHGEIGGGWHWDFLPCGVHESERPYAPRHSGWVQKIRDVSNRYEAAVRYVLQRYPVSRNRTSPIVSPYGHNAAHPDGGR